MTREEEEEDEEEEEGGADGRECRIRDEEEKRQS